MVSRFRCSLPWLGAAAVLLLLPLPVRADAIDSEPYVEEQLEDEVEAELEDEDEAELEEEAEAELEEEAELGEEAEAELDEEAELGEEVEDETEVAAPSGRNISKAFDIVLLRPVYFVRLVAGLPFFVFYPMTIGSDWGDDVVTLLWTDPYEVTFVRPLGEPFGDDI
jgi:hypothetical protein